MQRGDAKAGAAMNAAVAAAAVLVGGRYEGPCTAHKSPTLPLKVLPNPLLRAYLVKKYYI